jgi:hypothetical protein
MLSHSKFRMERMREEVAPQLELLDSKQTISDVMALRRSRRLRGTSEEKKGIRDPSDLPSVMTQLSLARCSPAETSPTAQMLFSAAVRSRLWQPSDREYQYLRRKCRR